MGSLLGLHAEGAAMNTEFPKENGWYWLIRRDLCAVYMSHVFTAENGQRMLAIHGTKLPSSITIYHQCENFGECEFIKIQRPSP